MSRIYGEQHRKLQDEHETRKLADTVENVIVQPEITDQDKAFIESRDMVFLSTVDHLGRRIQELRLQSMCRGWTRRPRFQTGRG